MNKSKKHLAILVISICVTSTLFLIAPAAFAETRKLDIRVLSYSWYISSFTNEFIVVGEVQNFEPATVNSAIPTGMVYTKDGQAQATPEYAIIFANGILPNQKAPFYMEFSAASSTIGNLSWIALGVDHVDFSFYGTTTTEEPQDSGVQVMAHTSSVDYSGNYTVTGVLMNRGALYPENVWVVATFYNASGTVVAAGVSKYATPHFLPPNQTAMFSLIPTDPTPEMASEIATYELQVLWSGSTTPPTPSPFVSPSTSSSTSPSPTSAEVSPSQQATTSPEPEPSVSIPLSFIYAAVAVVAVAVVIIIVVLVLRKRAALSRN